MSEKELNKYRFLSGDDPSDEMLECIMRDASAANDNVFDNFGQIFKHYSPETIRKIL